jgi:multiple sugar transport system permease protein/alpha-1,4-digalacturonate transport system permease protein
MLRNTAYGWSFILPNFIGFAVFSLIPILFTFYYAFRSATLLSPGEFVGLANFERMFSVKRFWIALWNTFYYVIGAMPLTLVASLCLALVLNNKLRFVGFFRTAAFFPYVTSIVAIAVVWNAIFSPEYGPLNAFLRFLGVDDPPGWVVDADWAMPAIIIVGIWRNMGYYMILFLAGLQTIPQELYEAATVDGASKWGQFWNVTWPGLRPTTFLITVLLTINSFKVFDTIFVMTEGGPGTATLVLSQYIFQEGFGLGGNPGNKVGYASAVSIVLFGICLIFTIIQYWWTRRINK